MLHCFVFYRFPELETVLNRNNLLLVYPGPRAIELTDYEQEMRSFEPHTLIVLDGTWQQARGIYTQNPFLHSLKQVF